MCKLTPKQRQELISSRTLATVTPGSILEVISKGEIQAGAGVPTQAMTVDVWVNGDYAERGVRIVVPLRLSGGEFPFSKGSVLVFMGKAYPRSLASKDKNWCWLTHAIYPGPKHTPTEKARELSLIHVEDLRVMFERGTLDRFKAGTILTIWSMEVKQGGGSDPNEQYAVIKYTTENTLTSGDLEQKSGEVSIPGRFIDYLSREDALPCNALYQGKKRSGKGGREYHDLHFIDGSDSRIADILQRNELM